MRTIEPKDAASVFKFEVLNTEEDSALHDFNQRILTCQDEAFTLAYYLLGGEEWVGTAMQEAILTVYLAKPKCAKDIRLRLLREIIHSVQRNQRRGSGLKRYNASPAMRLLRELPISKKSAVVLVDVLGLGYREASTVLSCSYRRLSMWIAQGRRQLGQELENSKG